MILVRCESERERVARIEGKTSEIKTMNDHGRKTEQHNYDGRRDGEGRREGKGRRRGLFYPRLTDPK